MFWNDDRKIADLRIELYNIREELLKLHEKRGDFDPKVVSERLADLEVKMSKLWSLLLETSPASGRERLTKFGKMFGGKARQS